MRSFEENVSYHLLHPLFLTRLRRGFFSSRFSLGSSCFDRHADPVITADPCFGASRRWLSPFHGSNKPR